MSAPRYNLEGFKKENKVQQYLKYEVIPFVHEHLHA